MPLDTVTTPQFFHKTALAPHEYRKNFRQIDCDAIALVRSDEATAVTGLMSKIYLGLIGADHRFFEREGVLHFTSEVRHSTTVTAWQIMCEVLGVAGNTAAKALKWLHEKRVIGYHAAKNGVGIRIFLNRAASSVGTRTSLPAAKVAPAPALINIPPAEKNLPFLATTKGEAHTTSLVAPFKVSGLRETLDQERDPMRTHATSETLPTPDALCADNSNPREIVTQGTALPLLTAGPVEHQEASVTTPEPEPEPDATQMKVTVPLSASEAAAVTLLAAQIVALQTALAQLRQSLDTEQQAAARHFSLALAQLKYELLQQAHQAAGNVAAEAVRREYERTREWFEQRALPKAVRVAQRESFDLLRKEGFFSDREAQRRAGLQVGRQALPEEALPPAARAQSADGIRALAEICVTLQETHGQDLNTVLGHLCACDGSPLLPSDLARIKDFAQALAEGRETMSNPLLLAPRSALGETVAQC
jgi:hypothetical protein